MRVAVVMLDRLMEVSDCVNGLGFVRAFGSGAMVAPARLLNHRSRAHSACGSRIR